jgi:hypothetical protein
MARYIDADKVMEKISHITVTVMGGRSDGKTIFVKALNSYREEVLKRIEDAPTADVVPKSEVEELKAIIADHKASEERLEELYSNAKSEVAREIFEEIDRIIFGTIIPNDCAIISIANLAELKNKYTEDKE